MSLTLIVGCMFSGKTTELIRRVERYKIAGKRCLIIRFAKDERYSKTHLVDHNKKLSILADISITDLNEIENICIFKHMKNKKNEEAWKKYNLEENFCKNKGDGREIAKGKLYENNNFLCYINNLVDLYEVIAIDEGQFISNMKLVDKWANSGKIVIISGLDTDKDRNSFKNISELMPLSERIIKLSAICFKCKEENAYFTHYLKNIKEKDGENFIKISTVGYVPLCRKCFNHSSYNSN